MSIASKVETHLVQHGVAYDVVTHPRSYNSVETAQLAHVRGDLVAKSVVLKDDVGFVMAVVPSTCHVSLGQLNRQLNRNLRLVTESQLSNLFADCELGAIPPLGLVYGMTTVVDDSLSRLPEIYFEGGDHEKLIHMKRDDFGTLMHYAGRARFAVRM